MAQEKGFEIEIMSVFALLLFFVPYVEAVEVDIPDIGLETAIREALILLGPITDKELAMLTFLDASEREIADLTSLECVNLYELCLYGNHISDINRLTKHLDS